MNKKTDIGFSSSGLSWSHTRSYDNQIGGTIDDRNGYRWKLDDVPALSRGNSSYDSGASEPDLYIATLTQKETVFFDKDASGYHARNDYLDLLEHDSTAGEFILRRPNGKIYTFHDFDQTSEPLGFLKSLEAPGGAKIELSYNTDGTLATATQSEGTDRLELAYSYVTCDDGFKRMQYVTLRSSANSGSSWTNIRRVKYTYYGSSETDGLPGDLKTVTTQLTDGSTWSDEDTTYYRYYKDGDTNGFDHGVKYILEAADYVRCDDALGATSPLDATDTQLADYATYYFEYDSDRRATKEEVEGGSRTYTFTYTDGVSSSNRNDWARRTTVTLPDGSSEKVYTNHLGQVLLKEHSPPSGSSDDPVIEYKVYNSNGTLQMKASSDAIISYSDNAGSGYQTYLDVSLHSDHGLIHQYEYYGNISSSGGSVPTGQPDGYLYREHLKQGEWGEEIVLRQHEYTSRTIQDGGEDVQTLYFKSKVTTYADESGTDAVATEYSYTWHSNSLQMASRTTTLPAVDSTENGQGTTHARVEIFDTAGNPTWSKDELGIITYHEYDAIRGTRTKTIQDVDTTQTGDFSNLPSGWSTVSGAGKHLISEFTYDDRGRMTESLGPAHEALESLSSSSTTTVRHASWTVYDDADREIRSASGYAILDTNGDVSSYVLTNPVSIVKRNASGRVTEKIQAKRASTSGKLAASDSFPQSDYLAWETQQYGTDGRLASTRKYYEIPSSGSGTEGTHYHQTEYGYDAQGRQNKTVSPDGTIARTVFDWRANSIETWIGTDDSAATDADPGGGSDPNNNMVKVTEIEYSTAFGGCSSCGGGQDKPRLVTQHVDSQTTRLTEYDYDWRGRRTHVVADEDDNGNVTYSQQTYDNLDRVTKSERFLLVVNSGSGTDWENNDPADDRLLARTENFYDARGRVWKVEHSVVDPSDGSVEGKFKGLTWYDAAGRPLKQIDPGADHFTKHAYDSLGRVTASYTGYDADESTYAEVDDVSGDTVLEQTESTYNDAGQLLTATAYARKPTASGTGALTSSTARATYACQWFDGAGRQIASANYGDNGGSALTRPDTVPTRSDNVLVTGTEFDDAGRASRTTDPAGKETRQTFDALGRATKTIQNYVDGTPSASNPDEDVTVEMVYHPSGQLETLTAKNPTTGDQVTTYVYGTTKTSIAPNLYRNDLLVAEIYPDSDDLLDASGILQNGSDNLYDRVEFQYNRQSERIWKKDQNGTIHTYEFDNLGRILHDRVTTLGSGVDNSVLRISTDYTADGNVATLTSYNNATVGSGNVVNQVEYQYDARGKLEREYQSHSGSVNTSTTPYVGYAYDTTTSGNDFTHALRPTSITYPDGRDLYLGYGTSGTTDDLLNRVKTLTDDDQSTTLATYTYQGTGAAIKTQLNQPGATLDYSASVALDRFGRIADHAWNDGSNDLVRIKHGYDRLGNRLWREDPVALANSVEQDEYYTYDNVSQLVNTERGSLNAAKDGILSQSKNWSEDWDLDMTGNWSTFRQDTNGDGTWDLNQSRTHNKANEIATIASASTHVAHDASGNMTRVPKPSSWSSHFHLVYDAWNRLVTVKDADDSTLVAEYQYDGRNFRIVKKTYDSGTLDETRHYYYNRNWQCLEERIGTSSTADRQYVWGMRYIDDLILRDDGTEVLYSLADPNWNVAALIDDTGSVQERYRYNAYGERDVQTASFGSRAASSYDWEYSFTTRRLDAETGCMYYRNRYYHPTLGRFQKRDPIGYEGGMNLFNRSMILSAVDPYGLSDWVWPWDPDASWDPRDTLELWGNAIAGAIESVIDVVCFAATLGGNKCLQSIQLCLCGLADVFDIVAPLLAAVVPGAAGLVGAFGIAECFLCEIWTAVAYACDGGVHGGAHMMGTGIDCLVSFLNKYSPVKTNWTPRQLRRNAEAMRQSLHALMRSFYEGTATILEELDTAMSTGSPSLGHCFRIKCECFENN